MCPSQFLANQINSNNGKAWVYYFDRVRDGEAGSNENVRAYHGAELPYVFDTHDPWMTTTEKDIALTKILTDYWTQFAKTGNPNAEHLPNWPVFDISKKSVQKFGDYVGTINSPEPILCDLFFKNATF
jgi:para-nitrobenzyl esterase